MKKVVNLMIMLGILHVPYVYSGNEEYVKTEIEQAQNAINEDNEVYIRRLRSVNDWPSNHPSAAEFANFSRFRDSFDFYIWQENNNIWVEVLPVTNAPFDSYARAVCRVAEHLIVLPKSSVPNS